MLRAVIGVGNVEQHQGEIDDLKGNARMAKKTGDTADRLSALVLKIEADAYARGKADARTEFLAALGASEVSASALPRNKPSEARPARKRRAGAGKRAPKGSVRALVERALRDRAGLKASEVLDRADTDAERMVKLSSIGIELTKGRRQGRYVSEDGRWSLAASPAVGGGAPGSRLSPDPDDAESVSAEEGPDDQAASGKSGTDANQNRLGLNW